ncbi:MAG: CDP-diacylglycerol--serine O-phosphatidyltransferase, partial [Psychrobacillus psychrotolerans]
ISEPNGFFTGLPITVAGVILTLSYFAIEYIPSVSYMFLFIILALLMISTFTLRKV